MLITVQPIPPVPEMSKIRSLSLAPRTEHDSLEIEKTQRASWPGLCVERYRIQPTSYAFALPNTLNLLVLLDIYRTDGETIVEGQSPNVTKDLRNKMTFVPAGATLCGWSKLKSAGGLTAVYFDPALSRDTDVALADIPPTVAFEDSRVRALLDAFSALAQDNELDVAGYAETLTALLVYELNRFGRVSLQRELADASLSYRQVERITEFIEGNLARRFTIEELADAVGLSRSHFIRAFKRTKGIPPHQFILRRRVERAKELLASSSAPVSVIAQQSGFNGLNQLTRVFRKLVGVTPSTFRQDLSSIGIFVASLVLTFAVSLQSSSVGH